MTQMLFVIYGSDGAVSVTYDYQFAHDARTGKVPGRRVVDRNSWSTYEDASLVAWKLNDQLPALPNGKRRFVATNTPGTSPQFDVVEVPAVGAAVSRAFNGDSYVDGHVVSVSASGRVIKTSTGGVYYRRRLTGTWKLAGSPFALVLGHKERRNMEM